MFQITEITRGYQDAAERERDIEALTAEGYDHFMRYRDTAATYALCYGRTPKREIQHLFPLRHNPHDPGVRGRIRYNLSVLRKQRLTPALKGYRP